MDKNLSEEYEIESEAAKAINWVKVFIVGSVLLIAVILVTIFTNEETVIASFFILPLILFLLIFVILVAYYMLPTNIAMKRGMPKGELSSLRLFNIILGFTVVGWYLAFQWAISYPPRQVLRRKECNDSEND